MDAVRRSSWHNDLARSVGADEDLNDHVVDMVRLHLEPIATVHAQHGLFDQEPRGRTDSLRPKQLGALDHSLRSNRRICSRLRAASCAGLAGSLMMIAVACSSSGDRGQVSRSSSRDVVTQVAGPSDPSSPETTVSTVSEASADSTQQALQVVLTWLVDPGRVDPDRFTTGFLDQAPIERVQFVLSSLGAGRWQASEITHLGTDQLTAHLAGPGSPQFVYLMVDGTGRMSDLSFFPDVVDPPTSLNELTGQLAVAGETAGFVRADVPPGGTCEPVAQLDADRVLPIGSVFKLYVLGAVAEAVQEGRIRWDTEVTIRDELDSLPAGVTQDEPPGSSLWVSDLARRMIEISDNTATDHLIDLVGRDAVERALGDLGHSDPAQTLPLLTTRELFTIKADPELLGRYQVADEAQRRALLATDVAAAPLPTVQEFGTEPRAVNTVEWFASPDDICRAWIVLHRLASTPGLEPLGEFLAANPAGYFDHARFPEVWSRRGAEPGVAFVSWLAERPDGSLTIVAGGVADSMTNVEEDDSLIQLIRRGLTLDD